MEHDALVAVEAIQHHGINPAVLRRLIDTAGIGQFSEVLEVGCGTGHYSLALSAVAGCSCWGIDPDDSLLEIARERHGQAHFIQGIAEALPSPAMNFDLVFSVDVIHLLGNLHRYFSEAHRVLKAGGRLCTITQSEMTIRHREVLSVYFPETLEADLRRYPSLPAIRGMMAVAGFTEIEEALVELPCRLTELSAYRNKAFACLRAISDDAFRRGLHRLEQALPADGLPWTDRFVMVWGRKVR